MARGAFINGTAPASGVYSLGVSGGFTPLRTNVSFAGTLILDLKNAAYSDRGGSNRASGARFYPYGDEITSTTNDREKFGTYLRDGFTGFDYADQRYYASAFGAGGTSAYYRFLSPDPYAGSIRPYDPASWNRFMYCHDDPINCIDPTGLVDWNRVGWGVVSVVGGVLGTAAGVAGSVPTLGGTAIVAIMSAGGISFGIANIAAGLSASGSKVSGTVGRGLDLGAQVATPFGLAGAVLSGGNRSAIAAGAAISNDISIGFDIAGLFGSGAVGFGTNLLALAGDTKDAVTNSNEAENYAWGVAGPPITINIQDTMQQVSPVPSATTQQLEFSNGLAPEPGSSVGITDFSGTPMSGGFDVSGFEAAGFGGCGPAYCPNQN